jgi:predicted permease
MPLILIGISLFVEFPQTTFICALCSLAMPLGLNTIVIPSAYGKDTSVGARMAIISHLLSVITIPVIFSMI